MLRRPPRSTLFPYTTLSRPLGARRGRRGEAAGAGDGAHTGRCNCGRAARRAGSRRGVVLEGVVLVVLVPVGLGRGGVVVEGDGAAAGPVQVRAELVEDVLPQVVQGAADADPGVLTGAADEGLDAQPQRADLGAGDEPGERAAPTAPGAGSGGPGPA